MTLLTALLFGSLHAKAAAYGTGVGLVLGEPTGLSLAWRDDPGRTIQSHLSWSLANDRFRGNVDFLKTLTTLSGSGGGSAPVYLGLGVIVGFGGDSVWAGGRVPFGIAFNPNNTNLEIFGEVALALYLIPGTDVDFEGGLGLRLYF